MRKLKIGLGLLLAAVMLVGLVGVGWGAATLDDVAKDLQQLQIQVARMEGRMDEAFKYLDWKISLIIALVLAILGFVFYLAREIGFGTREKIEKIRAYLDQVSDKLHLPKPLL